MRLLLTSHPKKVAVATDYIKLLSDCSQRDIRNTTDTAYKPLVYVFTVIGQKEDNAE